MYKPWVMEWKPIEMKKNLDVYRSIHIILTIKNRFQHLNSSVKIERDNRLLLAPTFTRAMAVDSIKIKLEKLPSFASSQPTLLSV